VAHNGAASLIVFSYELLCLQACGDRVLRGFHEWEQHRQGRGHRKRISRLKRKAQVPGFVEEVKYSASEQLDI